jgi:hypothetical protein
MPIYLDYCAQGYDFIAVYYTSTATIASRIQNIFGHDPDTDITDFYYDSNQSAFALYTAEFGAATMPHNYLIDRDGNVRVSCGPVKGNEAQWRSWIEELL